MKLLLHRIYFLLLLSACSSSSESSVQADTAPVDLNMLSKSEGVMMQGFYWDVEPRGEWWNLLKTKIDDWKQLGINRIWLPPVSKGASGAYSMGYDPMDYFDMGEYNQMGTVKTRFGSRAELEALITKAHQAGIEIIADIVLNHNSGGQIEYNPARNKNTYTMFRPASGKFNRGYPDFHPNDIHTKDAEALFFEEQDLCHDQPNVKKWFWESDSSVAQYYKNTLKFDGWRFDYVKGFSPSVIKSWLTTTGGFSVVEAWDGNPEYLKSWVDQTGSKAFDFAAFYNMEQAFDGNNMTLLRDNKALFNLLPENAVTFVANHDTEKDTNPSNRINSKENKLLAYAYILTHPGYPCIFYSDYETQLSKSRLTRLILIHQTLAAGKLSVLFANNELYVAQRSGQGDKPGLVITINHASINKSQEVFTSFKNTTLYDYSETTSATIKTDARGKTNINTPANSYTIWAPKNF